MTLRQLLDMRSGLRDYNDSLYLDYTMNDPDWDVSPFDYFANRELYDPSFAGGAGMLINITRQQI